LPLYRFFRYDHAQPKNSREIAMQMLVNIDVPDLERAARFYCTALDLSVGRRLGQEALELLGSSSPIYLLLKSEGTSPSAFTRQTRQYERHWSPVHLDFVVPDIEIAVARAMKAGATLEKPIALFEWGKIAMFSDPFGHGFCLLQFMNRGYDEIAE
jgi:predicted enzyme related to lactoylglutathione lyase